MGECGDSEDEALVCWDIKVMDMNAQQRWRISKK
jgi:hypothetical protein